MARGQGTVTVKFLGDTSHFEKATETVGGGLKTLGTGFATLGKAAAIGFGAAAAAAIPFGIKAVQMASDVNESLSKVNTVFGQSGAEIDTWAKGAATSIGLSRGEALNAAGSFGNMFTQLGIGAPKAAEMSKNIVGLAADFASFHSADISDVIDAQSAAFRGEYDSLQRFLPLINAATVEQKAMAMTGKASAKALTAQEKALAVNALMAEGAGKAVGDFARTSDGLANQMRILKARAADFTAQVGSALLPVVMKGLDLLGDLSAQLKDKLAPLMERAADIVRGEVVPAFKSMVPVVERIGGFVKDNLAPILGALATVITSSLVVGIAGAVAALGTFITTAGGPMAAVLVAIGGPITLVVAGLAALAAGSVYAYQHFEKFRDIVDAVAGFVVDKVLPPLGDAARYVVDQFGNLLDWTKTIWPQIQEAITHVVNVVEGVIRTAIDVLSALWRAWGDDLWSIVKTVWNGIRETIENVVQLVKGIIQTFLAVLNGDWGTAWDGIKNIVGAVWDQIGNIISTAAGTIRSLVGGIGSAISEVAKGMWEPIKDGFKSAINWIIDRWNGLEFKAPHLPGLPDVTIGVPDIDRLATGGMFRGAAIVGEAGPELLVGSRSGQIVPNNQLGGATFNITFTGVLDKAGAAREIEQILTDFKRNGGNLRFT